MSPKPGGGEGTTGVGGATRDFAAGPVAWGARGGVGPDSPTIRLNRMAGGAPGSALRAEAVRVGAPSPRRCRGRFGVFGRGPGSSSPLTGEPVVTADFLAFLPSLVAERTPPELRSTTTGAPRPPPMTVDTAPATREAKSGANRRNPLWARLFDDKCAPPAGDDGVIGEGGADGSVGEVSPGAGDSEPVSAGRPYAIPGVATADPTPSTTARAPI